MNHHENEFMNASGIKIQYSYQMNNDLFMKTHKDENMS